MFHKTFIATVLATATLTTGAATASASDVNAALSHEAPITQTTTTTDSAAGSGRTFKFKFRFKKHFKHVEGGYGKKCHFLKKKAKRTGRHFWWAKYKRCLHRYYD